jgi:hypothetical protein
VYLLGCTASKERWGEAEAGFRRAARSFRVGGEPSAEAAAKAAAEGRRDDAAERGGRGGEEKTARGEKTAETAAGDVDLNAGEDARNGERMNCKGPLPIFCSVEES